ncbi:hypothetical protein Csa_020940, partial [Cucumis sativus]
GKEDEGMNENGGVVGLEVVKLNEAMVTRNLEEKVNKTVVVAIGDLEETVNEVIG